MKNTVIVILIVVVSTLSGHFLFSKKDTAPIVTYPTPAVTTCTDGAPGDADVLPVITSLSKISVSVGDTLEINGCNFAGFEGDKNAWIENTQGVKGIIYGTASSTANLISAKIESKLCQIDTSYSGLPCSGYLNLTPGAYKIYTLPWGKKSNEITFTIR